MQEMINEYKKNNEVLKKRVQELRSLLDDGNLTRTEAMLLRSRINKLENIISDNCYAIYQMESRYRKGDSNKQSERKKRAPQKHPKRIPASNGRGADAAGISGILAVLL